MGVANWVKIGNKNGVANTYSNIVNGTDTTRFYYHLLDCSTHWTNDKPHVIYGYAVVDQGKTLTINIGVFVF